MRGHNWEVTGPTAGPSSWSSTMSLRCRFCKLNRSYRLEDRDPEVVCLISCGWGSVVFYAVVPIDHDQMYSDELQMLEATCLDNLDRFVPYCPDFDLEERLLASGKPVQEIFVGLLADGTDTLRALELAEAIRP